MAGYFAAADGRAARALLMGAAVSALLMDVLHISGYFAAAASGLRFFLALGRGQHGSGVRVSM